MKNQKGEEIMNFKEIFQEFSSHQKHLKVIFVASCDSEGRPNCAPKMLIHITEPNKVFYLDYKFTNTYANIVKNAQLSVSFMDDKSFTGYRLNGTCESIESGNDLELAKETWRKKLISYQADRMIERIKGGYSTREGEDLLPDNFVVVKFTATEAAVVKPGRILRA